MVFERTRAIGNPTVQRTDNTYTEYQGSRIDTHGNGETFVGYYVTLPNTNFGATVKLQGSMQHDDGAEVWVDLRPMDETGAQYASADVAIASGGTKYLLVAPDFADGALSAFRKYRIQIKSTNAGQATDVRVRGFAK